MTFLSRLLFNRPRLTRSWQVRAGPPSFQSQVRAGPPPLQSPPSLLSQMRGEGGSSTASITSITSIKNEGWGRVLHLSITEEGGSSTASITSITSTQVMGEGRSSTDQPEQIFSSCWSSFSKARWLHQTVVVSLVRNVMSGDIWLVAIELQQATASLARHAIAVAVPSSHRVALVAQAAQTKVCVLTITIFQANLPSVLFLNQQWVSYAVDNNSTQTISPLFHACAPWESINHVATLTERSRFRYLKLPARRSSGPARPPAPTNHLSVDDKQHQDDTSNHNHHQKTSATITTTRRNVSSCFLKLLKMICNDFLVVKVNCWSYVFNIIQSIRILRNIKDKKIAEKSV